MRRGRVRAGGETRAWKLATTCFPAAEVSLVVPGKVPGLVLDMARLGSHELGGDDLVRALRPLVTGYRRWLTSQAARVESDPEVARYAPAGSQALDRAQAVADRLERAVELLRTNGIAREAFRFANQAMAKQRVRSEVVRARLASPSSDLTALLREKDVPENRSWRPFQLAFVLLCLPGLTDPSHGDARRGRGSPMPRCNCCSSRPVAARPRRTWAWPRTRSRSGACRAWSAADEAEGTGRGAWPC